MMIAIVEQLSQLLKGSELGMRARFARPTKIRGLLFYTAPKQSLGEVTCCGGHSRARFARPINSRGLLFYIAPKQSLGEVTCCIWLLFYVLLFMLFAASAWADDGPRSNFSNGASTAYGDKLVLRFKAAPTVDAQVVRLGDLIEVVSWGAHAKEELLSFPLGPAPQAGKHMDWTATDLNRNLELRGIKKGLVVWQGPESVRLLRQRPVSAAASKPTSSESNGMVPAFVSDRLLSQAEGNLVQATREYLWLQTNERTQWRIKLKLPVELASSLSQRKNILSLGGGQAPWTGRQVFVYLIKHEGEEHELEMHVDVDYPTEVVVASRTLRRDEVLDESCLTYAPIGERQENAVDGFFEDMSELIGKQVRQAVSTGLPIPRTAIGEAHVISSGEIVELESVSGGIVVKVAAKALSGGAVGDTINVEMTPGRRRLAATVVNAGLVRILNKAASGDAPPEQEPMGKTSAPVATAKKTKARGELR